MQHHHAPHGLADLLDLDADVLHAYLSDVTRWVGQQAGGQPRRVLDLGAGTGTGTIALARCLAGAELIAVDQSAEMLARVRSRAADLGLAARVSTVQADLDQAWPAIAPVDVVWAYNVMHELASPATVLAAAFAAIRPGGLLAVAEMGAQPRFLPDDLGLGRPGLEDRCQAALAAGPATLETEAGALESEPAGRPPEPVPAAPRLDTDWGPRLAEAGFELLAQRSFVIDLKPPLPDGAGRYAQTYLRRIRPVLAGRLDAADLAVLDTLIDSDGPDGLLRRGDLNVRGTRTAWIGRRPTP
jgi:SAM-dependent methyltransferase